MSSTITSSSSSSQGTTPSYAFSSSSSSGTSPTTGTGLKGVDATAAITAASTPTSLSSSSSSSPSTTSSPPTTGASSSSSSSMVKLSSTQVQVIELQTRINSNKILLKELVPGYYKAISTTIRREDGSTIPLIENLTRGMNFTQLHDKIKSDLEAIKQRLAALQHKDDSEPFDQVEAQEFDDLLDRKKAIENIFFLYDQGFIVVQNSTKIDLASLKALLK